MHFIALPQIEVTKKYLGSLNKVFMQKDKKGELRRFQKQTSYKLILTLE
jgi:hypothetical protein